MRRHSECVKIKGSRLERLLKKSHSDRVARRPLLRSGEILKEIADSQSRPATGDKDSLVFQQPQYSGQILFDTDPLPPLPRRHHPHLLGPTSREVAQGVGLSRFLMASVILCLR